MIGLLVFIVGERYWKSTHGLERQEKMECDEIGKSEAIPLALFLLEQQGKLLQ